MTDKSPDKQQSSPGTWRANPQQILDRKISTARKVLAAERIWPRLWLPLIVAMLFAIATLAGLWTYLPPIGHIIGLGVSAIAFVASLIPLARVSWPTEAEGVQRIERISGIPHRPASSYRDELSASPRANSTGHNASETQTIWQAHRDRLVTFFKGLRSGRPRPRVDRHDPFAIRAMLVLGTVVMFFTNAGNIGTRFTEAFTLRATPFTTQARLDAWVTPPVYTGKAPLLLSDGRKTNLNASAGPTNVEAPENSVITIRVSLPDSPAAGKFSVTDTPIAGAFDTLKSRQLKPTPTQPEARASEFRIELKRSSTITVAEHGRGLRTWQFNMIPDKAPVIGLKTLPTTSARGALTLQYTVKDDYGVMSADAKFQLDRSKMKLSNYRRRQLTQATTFEPPHMDLRLPSLNVKEATGKTFQDFTAHPWAGLPVLMTLGAKDQGGKEGTHGPVKLILPARKFYNPMAKAVVEQRRKLVFNPTDRNRVVKGLKAITIAPEVFIKRAGVYLGLRSTIWRLTNDKKPEAIPSTVKQLWDIALRIEDGNVSDAERRLRNVQDQLSKALQDGAKQEEIDRLMKELRQAMNEFMKSLAEQARRNGKNQQQNAQNQQQLNSKDLNQMLKEIERMMKSGSRETAQQMLNNLREMLENLQAGRPQQGQQQGRANQMMQQLEKFGNLIQKQQRLLDDTFRAQRGDPQQGQQGQPQQGQKGQGQQGQRGQGQQGQQGQRQGQNGQGGRGQQGQNGQGQGGNTPGGLGQRQAELQQQLRQLLDQMGKLGAQTPQDLRDAERSMGEAGKSLQGQQLGRAGEQETEALSKLRSGTQSMAEQILKNMQTRLGMQQGRQRGRTDPLGRPRSTTGPDLGTSVKVPDQIDIQRAREILQELRNRLSNPNRPTIELDYLERLLEKF